MTPKLASMIALFRPSHKTDAMCRRLPFTTGVWRNRALLTAWLNMVEIEIGILRGQCLDRRSDDAKWLRREIAAWQRQRNAERARIKWMFTSEKARAKMGHAYPDTPKES